MHCILNHLSNQNKTHSYMYIIIFSASSNLPQISQNHILYGWGSKRCGHFLNNSIQANYNYFAVCVCAHREKKGSRLTCASEKKKNLVHHKLFLKWCVGAVWAQADCFSLSWAALWWRGITRAKLFPHVFRQGSVPTTLTVIICRNCADYLN